MKNKLLVLSLSLIAALGLAACAGGGNTSSEPQTSSEPTTSSQESLAESSDTEVHVESVEITLDKENAVVGEDVPFTVTVLPNNAANKKYTVAVDKSALAEVKRNKIATKDKGTVVVTVTSEDGNKTDSKTLVIAEPETPVISFNPTVSGHLNANVNEELTLPVASASANGQTVEVTFSDLDDPEGVNTATNKFKTLVAGEHRVRYVAENPFNTEYYDEEDVIVDVAAATPSTYDTTGHDDPDELGKDDYIYKDGFELASRSPLFRTISQATGAYSLIGTSDAIEGNSLLVDHSKMTISGTQCELGFTLIDGAVKRDQDYKVLVEFDYKIVQGSLESYKDMYFGLKYADGTDAGRDVGNARFVKAESGHYASEINFKIAENVESVWLHIFEHNENAGAGKIAFDNFSIQLKELTPPSVPFVVPTSEQLSNVGGYTFDFVTAATEFDGNSEFISNVDLPDEVKTAIESDAHFGANVYRVFGIDSHNMSAFDAGNLSGGDTVALSVVLYSDQIDDIYEGYDQFVLLQMVNNAQVGSEVVPTVTKLAERIYQFDFNFDVIDGLGALNLYVRVGNESFNSYIGSMTVSK